MKNNLLFGISFLLVTNAIAEDLSLAILQSQDTYRKSVESAILPAQIRYVAELQKLYEQSVKDGNIDDTRAIKNEIEGIAAQYAIGKWEYLDSTSPLWQSFDMERNGAATHSNGTKGTWKVRGEEIVIKWENNFLYIIPSLPVGVEFQGRIIWPSNSVSKMIVSRAKGFIVENTPPTQGKETHPTPPSSGQKSSNGYFGDPNP